MNIFDLAISYTWEYDQEFVDLIEFIFQKDGLTTFVISTYNVFEVINALQSKQLHFHSYLDRASDVDSDFEPIATILSKRKSYIINPHKKVHRFINKSFMHKVLSKKNFNLPKTIILPPYYYNHSINIKQEELDKIGNPFIIKPAIYTGGGEGVKIDATTIYQIQKERIKNQTEEYLIQEKIQPKILGGKRAWFRVFWAFNKVIPTWWDDQTHIYETISHEQIKKYNLHQLYRITKRLFKITRIDYFSTEIALSKKNKFVLIDYINDQCDMRLKSNHIDGVPDEVVINFIEQMKKKVLLFKK
ncbi:hypothetical protein [Rosettibacter firmus]|uniref:hypothetical protein n=1 Tax=Rosettibacter firmus TaxID=3111522 RepID=UPI00336BEFE1